MQLKSWNQTDKSKINLIIYKVQSTSQAADWPDMTVITIHMDDVILQVSTCNNSKF